MDKLVLGSRLAQAREVAGMTQEGLGRAVNLDRAAITGLERGERKLSVPELVAIAEVLGRPLSYFVNPSVPAVVSRRGDTAHAHDTTRALDMELDMFASDVRTLLELGLIDSVRRSEANTPSDHQAAERMARAVRNQVGLSDGPVADLGEVCQRLGLYAFSAALGEGGPDGGCVEVGHDQDSLGAAVINGQAPPGRRRMTLAHELGHWLCGDAYDREASTGSERMINSFAVHFLAPRAGVHSVWMRHVEWPVLDRALAVGVAFRLSWSATISQLKNVDLISFDDHRILSDCVPRRGDYVRLGLSWTDELGCPYISPGFAAGCVNGYVAGRLTSDRAIELLRGTLSAVDLPSRRALTLDDIRSSFTGHGD